MALNWMAQQREDALILACDGRSKPVRSHLIQWSEKSSSIDPAKAADVWVTYAAGAGNEDPREPKRKITFSATNRELDMNPVGFLANPTLSVPDIGAVIPN